MTGIVGSVLGRKSDPKLADPNGLSRVAKKKVPNIVV